jgi:photosystem II stability/assembly factor-like uncharacterized protein
MALIPSSEYPAQIDTSDSSGFPYGAAQNDAVVGDGTGTPLEKAWVNDLWGFQQALLKRAHITPSGTPDKVGTSDYLDALEFMLARMRNEAAIVNSVTRSPAGAYSGVFNCLTSGLDGSSKQVWVLAGDTGEIQTGDDASWTQRTAAASYSGSFRGAVYAESVFVLVGDSGEIQTSPDGTTWTHRTAAASYSDAFRAVAHDGAQFCAVGDSGEIQTSPDGTTWTHRTAAASYSGAFNAIVWTGSAFVAVGDSGEIQTSPDGTTWTHRTAAAAFASSFLSATYAFGRVVIAGASAEIQTSDDNGATWTHQTGASGFTSNLRGLAATPYLFVAVGSTGEIQTSSDGVTWVRQNRKGFGATTSFAYFATAYNSVSRSVLIVGDNSTLMRQSLYF